MLCCDVRHKVLRTPRAYQLIKDVVAQKPADMKGSVLKALLGAAGTTTSATRLTTSIGRCRQAASLSQWGGEVLRQLIQEALRHHHQGREATNADQQSQEEDSRGG
jgi:hypothetical protein